MKKKQILLANPRGFCAGVDRAVQIVEKLLIHFNETVYVRHEIVHNRFVVNSLRSRGVVFISELTEVPDKAIVVFSAHGVSLAVEQEAKKRKLRLFDSTCPLVSKVHMEVLRISNKGDDCILIGHKNHPEVIGTMGRFDYSKGSNIYLVEDISQAKTLKVNNPDKLHLVTQTTLSVDDTAAIVKLITDRYPKIKASYRDICYATQNRQNAVKKLVTQIDVLIVVGSINSSNSSRLQEIGTQHGIDSYLVDRVEDVAQKMLDNKYKIGLTAGASAPDELIQKIILKLETFGYTTSKEQIGEPEEVIFKLPKSIDLLNMDNKT